MSRIIIILTIIMADNTGLPSTYSACCRLCLSEKVDVLKGLFDDDESISRCIQQKILSSLGIEVSLIIIIYYL